VAAGENGDQAVQDRGAVELIVDVGVVYPEAVYPLFAEICDQLVHDEILPGLLGGVDPSLVRPVVVLAKRVLFEALVVGTIGRDRSDTQIAVDLAAAGFELFDLSLGIILAVDDDRLVVFDFGSVSVQGRSDKDAPGRGLGGSFRGDLSDRDDGREAEHGGKDQSGQTLCERGIVCQFSVFFQMNPSFTKSIQIKLKPDRYT